MEEDKNITNSSHDSPEDDETREFERMRSIDDSEEQIPGPSSDPYTFNHKP